MASLSPYAELTLAVDRTFFGAVTYCGDDIAWQLPAMIGRADAAGDGLCLDADGQYVIQTPIYVPVDADETRWAASAPSLPGLAAAQYAHGTDQGTGRKFLRQTVGTYGVSFDITFVSAVRAAETGFVTSIYRGGPNGAGIGAAAFGDPGASDHTFYLEFSAGAVVNLRLAVEKGSPIRLEVTNDGGGTWATVQTSALGDSETYLNGRGRMLDVGVFPETDADYYAAGSAGLVPTLSAYQQGVFTCDPPPSRILVTLGGNDEVFVYHAPQASLAAGPIRVYGQGGQWGLRYWQLWHRAQCSLSLPAQVRARQFRTQASGVVGGYVPPENNADVAPDLLGLNSAQATLTVSGPATPLTLPPSVIVQGCPRTCILSTALLDFPPSFLGPQPGVGLAQFGNDTVVEWEHEHSFDQANFFGRAQGTVEIADTENLLNPGTGLTLGVQAFQLFAGLRDRGLGYDDGRVAMTGLVGIGKGSLAWEWRDGIKYVRLKLSDRLRMHVVVAYVPVMDGQCHYHAMRQLGYRLGFTDDQMDFPYCTRDSQCPHYHLPQGTTFDPLWRFDPNTGVVAAMLQVRRYSGEIDAATGTVLPMYLYVDRMGVLQYYGAPVGLVSLWLDGGAAQSQTIDLAQTYSAVPQLGDGGLPSLNEFVRTGPMGSVVNLDNIRAPVVMQGLDPFANQFVFNYAANEALISSPGTPGYVGLPVPYIETSRMFSSQNAVDMALAVAEVQYSFPSIESYFTAHYQSGLGGLEVIGVQEEGTQGTTDPVPYYTTLVRSHGRSDGAQGTYCEGRLLGQAGS